jgi:hypothetical protein
MVTNASLHPDLSHFVVSVGTLSFTGFTFPASGLVPEFAIVHQTADRRLASGSYLNQVKTSLL